MIKSSYARFVGAALTARTAILSLCLSSACVCHAGIVDTLLTFDEVILPPNSRITSEYSHYGVTFSNAFFDVQGWDVPTGRHIANFDPAGVYPYLEISFATDVRSASFLIITNYQNINTGPPGLTTFQALRDGRVVDEFIGATDLAQRAFGFSNFRFDQIRVYPGGWGNFGRLDNLAFQSVPEPDTALLLSVAVAVGYLRSRSRDSFRPRY